jgi:hypothetical protein
MEQCSNVVDAAKDVIVLAVKLADSTVHKSPGMVKKILEDDKLNKAVKEALLAEGKRLASLQRQGKPIGNDQGTKVLQAVGKAASAPAMNAAKREIERTSEYRAVQAGLKQLECSFRQSPMGVFVDEHKGLLIIVASGLAIGGAVAMYVAKSGDWAASKMASLASKKLRFKVLGNVEVGAKQIKFNPSERKVELTTFSTASWKAVKVSLNLPVTFKDVKLMAASAKGELKLMLGRNASLTGRGAIGYTRPTKPGEQPLAYDLGLGLNVSGTGAHSKLKLQVLGFVKQDAATRSMGGSGTLKYGLTGSRPSDPSVAVTFGAKGSRVETFQPSGPAKVQTAFETKLGVEITF